MACHGTRRVEGKSRDGALPVPANCFSSTYSWDQNILFFVGLGFNCYPQDLVTRHSVRETGGMIKMEGGNLLEIQGPSQPSGQTGRAEPSFRRWPTLVLMILPEKGSSPLTSSLPAWFPEQWFLLLFSFFIHTVVLRT